MVHKKEKINPKVVFTIGNLEVGGAAKMLCYVANLSIKYFSDVSIIILNKNEKKYFLEDKIKIYELNLVYGKRGRLKDFLFRCWELKKIFRQLKPDIVIAFVNPTIIYSFFAKRMGTILVGADRGNPEKLPRFNYILSRYVYPRCDMLIFQSEGVKGCFNLKTWEKAHIIENPYVPSGKDPGCFLGKRSNTIVSASRLSKEKNIDIIIRAFSQSNVANTYTLLIYGDGPEKQYLKDLVKELQIESQVQFLGTSNEIMTAIQDAGMFILVSDSEGMPNGLIEAMALGIPCISTKCMANQTNSLIEHQKNGLIVKKGDVQDLKEAINYLCDNPCKAQQMGNEATKIRILLEETKIREKWGIVFETLLRERGG